MKTPSFLTRSYLFAAFFFGLLLFLLYQMTRLLAPLFSPLLWAAILALALHPLTVRLTNLLKGRRGLSSAIMTLLTLLLIVGPAISLLAVLAGQAVDLYQWATAMAKSGKLAEVWSQFTTKFIDQILAQPALSGIDIKAAAVKGIGNLSSLLAGQIGGILKNSLIFIADVAIMLFTLFFFFRDGDGYYQELIGLLPFSKQQKDAIAWKFSDTFRAVINGVFLIALIQGALTGIGFFIFGISFAVLWGFLAAVVALLPIGGAALVWLPGAAYLFLTGSQWQGILLALWGLVLVSLPDNFLRPLIIGRKTNIPTFILFIALLGGLQAYGILGILFGPLIVTLLTTFIQIYREEYAEG